MEQPPASAPSPPPRPLGSPTANRLALGRAVPRPLDLASSRAHSYSSTTPSASSTYTSSPPTAPDSLVSPRAQLASPTTPDRATTALAGNKPARDERSASAEGADRPRAHAHAPSPTSSPALASLTSPPTAARPSTSTFPSPVAGYAARRASGKLPASASTTSIGGRSVLGYTSAARRTGSPHRGGGSGAGATPLGTSAGAGAGPAGGGGAGASGTGIGTTSSSRFLLTVVPPEHLPHDPPHPRTNPACSGYGPPEHFRRGTLVPLYPTLSSQLAAIAREYGLPSSGGLVLYLLSTTDPATQQPFPQSAGFAGEGGPRISDGAWNLLWAQLMAEEEAERDMLLYEQQQREHDLLDSDNASDDDDNDYRPPPVPPIPSEHAAPRQREQSEDVGIFSDEQEQERVSQSSVDGGASDGKAPRADNRASAIARAGLGRGPPPSTTSPGAGVKRFSSFPTAANPSLTRRTSRQSLRSASHRTAAPRLSSYNYAAAPPSARAVSYGSSRFASGPASLFSPSTVGASAFLPGYGASVVVGKVEFDIHAGSRQGKWYEAWLASASQPASSGTSSVSTPAVASSAPAMAFEQPHQSWHELQLPSRVASAARSQEPAARGLGIVAAPPAHEPHRFDTATLASAALSSSSLAAMAGHSPTGSSRERALVPDESSPVESEPTPLAETVALPPAQKHALPNSSPYADSSIVDHLAPASSPDRAQLRAADTSFGSPAPLSHAPSSLPSRPASTTSTVIEGDDSSSSEHGSIGSHLAGGEHGGEDGYAPLEDEDEAQLAVKPAASDADSDELRYGSATAEDGGVHDEPVRGDPLADVFESDEATWRSIADDDSYPRLEERDAVETTGLGISGARNVAELEPVAAPDILERREQDETLDERGLPPPQDDVRDVVNMLSSTPTTATHPINLASPIRLDSSGAAATGTGVFPPSPVQQVAVRESNAGHGQEDRSSPFLPSHSAATSISTVNFSVRPPSTIASMSPEYVQNRKQRQGWTNVPAVVDPSLSTSSSMSSISAAGAASNSARSSSSTGLMDNLDDLERALADLSPRASARARMGAQSPAAVLEAAGEAPSRAEPPRPGFPPRTSSREQTEEGEAPSAVPASPAPPSSLLASRPAFRYRAPSSPGGGSGASGANDVPSAAVELVAPAEPVRIPRSSSLSKPVARAHPQPHLVALPPSPMPANVATFAHSPDALDEPLPALPSASPSWPAAPPLPPSPSPPVQPFDNFLPRATAAAPPQPPPPPAAEDPQPSQPRSPGSKKSGFKWGSRNKSIDAGKANAAPPSVGDAQSPSGDDPSSGSGAKSPLGSFFGKFGKGDKKGFFRRNDSASPEPPVPAPAADAAAPVLPALPPRQPSLDAETEHFFSGAGRPRRPSVSATSQPPSSLVEREAHTPPASAPVVVESASSSQEQEAPASSLPPLAELSQTQQRDELFGVAPSTPAPTSATQQSLPLAAHALSPPDSQHTSSPPPAHLDFPAPPPSTVTAATPHEPPHPRASSSFGSPSPRASLSAQSTTSASSSAASASTLLSPTQPAFPFSSALPPSPALAATDVSPTDAPATPRPAALSPPSSANTGSGLELPAAAPATPRYPASAPVTPAAWHLSSRAALGTPSPSSVSTSAATGSGLSPSGASARSRARLSADIEGLLSQMREIDFALEDPPANLASTLTTTAAATVEPVDTAPRLLDGLERDSVEPQPQSGAALDEPPPFPTPTLVEPDEDTSLVYAGGAATPDLSSSLSSSLSGFATPPPPVRAYAGVGAGASASPGLGAVNVSLGVPGFGAGDDGELPRPLSADLRAIGSVMTLGSPPTSPELTSPRYDPLQVQASPTRA